MMIGLSTFFFPPAQVRAIFFKNKPISPLKESLQIQHSMRGMLILGIYFLFQLFLPIRHFFIQGDVLWTEEGHRMAWRMMLRSKGGSISFKVKDTATGETWEVNPYTELTNKQVSKLGVQPDMIWQFAQLLKYKYRQEGKDKVEVYAISSVSLNGDSSRPMVDSTVNLAGEAWNTFKHARWILTYE
jgi:hypothetical protein